MDYNAAENFVLQKLKNELPPLLSYHSYRHTLDVLEAAIHYAKLEQISDYEQVLLKTAVLFHDIGFTKQLDNHEEIGCEIAKSELAKLDYDQNEIDLICGMIMATKIPQSPQNKREQIICDADLDYLGRDDFWEIARLLFQEINQFRNPLTEDEWNNIQLKFLNSHEYFTKSALSLRKAKKDLHTQKIKASLEK